MNEIEIANGLTALISSTRRYADSLPLKLQAMQEAYLRDPSLEYSAKQIRLMSYYMDALLFKFYLSTLHLEQLWSLSHGAGVNITLREVLDNSFDRHDLENDNLLLTLFSLEGFVIQGSSFFDFFSLYILIYFRLEPIPYLSESKLIKALESLNTEIMEPTVKLIRKYYLQKDPKLRRKFLKSLRNSIVHRDMLLPSFNKSITLLDKLLDSSSGSLLDSSTARFSQDMQNDMFSLATDLLPNMFNLEWKPGPYKPDLW